MKKIKFENYRDGIFLAGNYIEFYENDNLRKELTITGKFFFNYLSIREEDRYSLDTDNSKISLKIKVRKNNLLKTNQIIQIGEKLYTVKYIDSNQTSLFLYLTDYADELDRIIEIYETIEISTLKDPEDILFKKIFANIKNINSVTNSERETNNAIKTKERLKFKVKYLPALTEINANNKFNIVFENKKYNITQIVDIDMKHEVLEIEGELIGIKS
ncbi:MAG: phage head closure protein [Sarcina sp.]